MTAGTTDAHVVAMSSPGLLHLSQPLGHSSPDFKVQPSVRV